MLQETLTDITNTGFFTVFGQELMKAYKNPGSGTMEEREERDKKLFPIAAQAMTKFVSDAERIAKKLKSTENVKYLFGDQLTLADLDCLKYKVMMDDPTFNKYADFKSIFATHGPTLLEAAESAATDPGVAKYLAKDGKNVFTGINLLW